MKRAGKAIILESAEEECVPSKYIGKTKIMYHDPEWPTNRGTNYVFKGAFGLWYISPENVKMLKEK